MYTINNFFTAVLPAHVITHNKNNKNQFFQRTFWRWPVVVISELQPNVQSSSPFSCKVHLQHCSTIVQLSSSQVHQTVSDMSSATIKLKQNSPQTSNSTTQVQRICSRIISRPQRRSDQIHHCIKSEHKFIFSVVQTTSVRCLSAKIILSDDLFHYF